MEKSAAKGRRGLMVRLDRLFGRPRTAGQDAWPVGKAPGRAAAPTEVPPAASRSMRKLGEALDAFEEEVGKSEPKE